MGRLHLTQIADSGNDEIRFNSKGVGGKLNMHKFQDKDTLEFVFYCPSLELSGYGKTEELALQMVTSSIEDFLDLIAKMSFEDKGLELRKLGWHKTFFNKRFSKAFVDANGELQNFNAVGNSDPASLPYSFFQNKKSVCHPGLFWVNPPPKFTFLSHTAIPTLALVSNSEMKDDSLCR